MAQSLGQRVGSCATLDLLKASTKSEYSDSSLGSAGGSTQTVDALILLGAMGLK